MCRTVYLGVHGIDEIFMRHFYDNTHVSYMKNVFFLIISFIEHTVVVAKKVIHGFIKGLRHDKCPELSTVNVSLLHVVVAPFTQLSIHK